MPQRPVRRRHPSAPASATQPNPPSRLRVVQPWVGWDAAVHDMIQERGPRGSAKFGQGQADNYLWILCGERSRLWRAELGITCPEDVTPEALDSLTAALRDEANLKPASVQQYVKNLKTFLKWCKTNSYPIDEGALEVDNIDLGDEEPPDPFSMDELVAMKKAAKTPVRAFFVDFAWRTGLRVSEMERVNIDDLKNDGHGWVLHIPWGAAKPNRRWRTVPLDTKSRKFGPEIRRYIQHDRGVPYYDENDPEGSADAANALFLNEDGKRWRAEGMQSFVRRLGSAANVPGAHVHRFRHTFGTWCAGRGMNVAQIMFVGGWSSPNAALRYIKFTAHDAVRFFSETND